MRSLCRVECRKLEEAHSQQYGDSKHDLSAVSEYLRSIFALKPDTDSLASSSFTSEELEDADISNLDKLLLGGTHVNTRFGAELDLASLVPKHPTAKIRDGAPNLFSDLHQMMAEEISAKLPMPPPPQLAEHRKFTYPEWRLVRKRRRQADLLKYRVRMKGKWSSTGVKQLKSGWFVGMKRKPIDFSSCYN